MSAPASGTPHSPGQVLPFRQTLLAMLGMCFVMMMVAIDQTVVGTALPTIVAELKGFELYAWVATSYLLTSVITVPIFGRLGDYYGRKPFVVAAIVLFTLASVLCGAADSMFALVLARALQGIGGGMLVGTAFASIPDLFPDPHVRLRWQVMLSSAFGIANAVGPTLGGALTEHYGWRSVFYVNLPIGILGLWFVTRYLPHLRNHATGKVRLDWQGALLIAAALGSLQRTGRGSHARACNRQRAVLQTAEFKLGARCGGSGIAQKIHATFRTGLRGCALGKGRQTRHDQRCDGSELHSGTIPRRFVSCSYIRYTMTPACERN